MNYDGFNLFNNFDGKKTGESPFILFDLQQVK